MIRNSKTGYGWLATTLHWLMALLLVALFGLGLWMVSLGYYDPWYVRGPAIHRSLGVIFFALLVLRIVWRLVNPRPAFESTLAAWERFLASAMQYVLYLLMLLIPISGYLISTAKGRPVSVFGWFDVPALIQLDGFVDLLGQWHAWMAWLIIVLVVLHASAALKHHFIDKDDSLRKILGLNHNN